MEKTTEARRPHPNCWGPGGHICQRPSGRSCIDCGAPAGTLWGSYWCPDCDVKRLSKIGKALDGVAASFAGREQP